jgi:AmmeMemoRadiSam system protein A
MMCPQPEVFPQPIQEFSRDERIMLLDLAHRSISAALAGRELSIEPPTPHLAEPRGVFTTLYYRGSLRGCIGHVFPNSSVYRTVADTALAAAFEDTRFYPVTAGEAQELEVSVSILSVLKPIRPEEVEVGVHGLLVSMAGSRGLLLPQVPLEHKWDRVQYLEQTCKKAGLPSDAWHSGAKLEGFTAEVFSDREM